MSLEKRISGFAQANGKKFESANSAYKSYLNAAGGEETPDAKPDFKAFLDAAKKTGVLDEMLKEGKDQIKKKTGAGDDKVDETPLPEKKKFTLSTTQIVGIVVGVAALGTIIYFATRKKTQTA